MGWIVTAGYVTVETSVGPGRARIDIPHGDTLPDDVPSEEIERFVRLGHIGEEQPDTPPPTMATGPELTPTPVPDGPIAAVLAWVGDDRDRARAALDVEQAKGDKARTGVVTPLTALVGTGE